MTHTDPDGRQDLYHDLTNTDYLELDCALCKCNLLEYGVVNVRPALSSIHEHVPHNVDIEVTYWDGRVFTFTCLSRACVTERLATQPYYCSQHRLIVTLSNSKAEIAEAIKDAVTSFIQDDSERLGDRPTPEPVKT